MDEKEILIKKAGLDDLDAIFNLYANYMFDSYLIRFGSYFVKKYLKLILLSKNCITLVAAEGHAVGFISATFNCRKMFAELCLNIEMLFIWIKVLLARPALALDSLTLISYPFKTSPKNVNAEFLFIAVEPDYRDRELATRLIKETLGLMSQGGVKKIKVSTLVKNEAVNALLRKLGFKAQNIFSLFKKSMYLYTYELF